MCNTLLNQVVYCCNVSCAQRFEPHTCIVIEGFGAFIIIVIINVIINFIIVVIIIKRYEV